MPCEPTRSVASSEATDRAFFFPFQSGPRPTTGILTTDGAELRKSGKDKSVDLDSSTWDRVSSTIMEHLIKLSFEQNGPARQRLLNTRNATLTHTQDTSKWKTEFPRILMKVRDELRTQGDNTTNQNNNRSNNTLKINKNEYTDEFRRVQEESSRMAQGALSEFNRGVRNISKDAKQRMGSLYGRLLS